MGTQDSLPGSTKLHWYQIESVLGHGGFGLTYLALDTNLDKKVAIKEYLPGDLANRLADSTVRPRTDNHKELYGWGLQRFLEEARTLVQFNHPNIVRVMSVFEANNTAYMVMEYEQGEELNTLMRQGNYRTEAELKAMIYPILDGLVKVHEAGFIHRDIKPGNIYIRQDNSPVLLDFGSARQSVSGHTQALTSLYTPGFAPFEQYHESQGRQGPWTDVYALGATLYLATTGERPADAMKRSAAYLHGVDDPYIPVARLAKTKCSKAFLNAIDQALCFYEKDRPQNTQDFKQLLEGKKIKARPTQRVKAPTAKSTPFSTGRRNGVRAMITLLLVAGIGFAGYRWWLPQQDEVALPGNTMTSTQPATTSVNQPVTQPSRIDILLTLANKNMQAGRLLGDDDDYALTQYKQVLQLDADNAKAKTGIEEIQLRYFDEVERLMASGQYSRTQEALQDVLSRFGQSSDLRRLEDKLHAALAKEREQQEAEAKRLAKLAELKEAQEQKRKLEEENRRQLAEQQQLAEDKARIEREKKQQQISQLLVQATQYIAAGRLANTPDGNDALGSYQKVLKLEPDNKSALMGIASLTERLANNAQVNKNQSSSPVAVNTPRVATLVAFADLFGEKVNSSRLLGDTLKTVSSKYIETSEINVNENLFIPSRQYEAATAMCNQKKGGVLIGVYFEKFDSGGGAVGQGDLKVLSFSCEKESMAQKTYVVWKQRGGWGSTIDPWVPEIKQSIAQFIQSEKPFSL